MNGKGTKLVTCVADSSGRRMEVRTRSEAVPFLQRGVSIRITDHGRTRTISLTRGQAEDVAESILLALDYELAKERANG